MDDELGLGELQPGRDYPSWFPVVGGDEDGVFIDIPGFPKWSPWKEKKPTPKPAKAAGRGSAGLGDLGALEGASGSFLGLALAFGAGILVGRSFGPKRRNRR